MTIGSIFLGLALLALVGLFIARPLFKQGSRSNRRPTTRQVLQLQKEASLLEIKNLDFDYETGKLPDDEYQVQRKKLMAQATDILKQMDALEESAPVSKPVEAPQMTVSDQSLDDEIEAAVAALREKQTAAAPTTAEQQKPIPANGQNNYCPQCGKAIDPDDKFCAHCGHKLLIAQSA